MWVGGTVGGIHNGFVVDVSGQDNDENWISAKFVFTTLDELKDAVQDLALVKKTLQ